MVGKSLMFVPGEAPGPYASGLLHESTMKQSVQKHLGMPVVPTGGAVSNWFPWWRTVTTELTATTRRTFAENAANPISLTNNSDKDIEITEVRMQVTPNTWDNNIYNQTGVFVQMGIPPRKDIIEEWLPWAALQTEPTGITLAELDWYVYKLPAPYFLGRGNAFSIDVQYDVGVFPGDVLPTEYAALAGLHGWGARDKEPIDLIKPLRGWDANSPAAGSYRTYTFDDDRGRPLRDAWITHMTFGASEADNSLEALQALKVRPNAPDGPAWHFGEFYALSELTEQIGSSHNAQDFMIHKPRAPYVLRPGEPFRIEYRTPLEPDSYTFTIVTTLKGRQKGI